MQLSPLSPCQEWWQLREQLGAGAVSGADPGQGSADLGGLAPHAELRQDQGHRCCILCTLRVSVPPGHFLPGCGSAGSRINPAAPVAIAGLCLSAVPSERGHLLLSLPLPPPGAVSSWQPFPAPTGAPVVPLGLLGGFAGNGPHPWEDPFVPEQTPELLGFSASGLGCRSPERKNNNEVCASGAFRPHLAVCALCGRVLCTGTEGNERPLPSAAQQIPKALTGIFILYFPG